MNKKNFIFLLLPFIILTIANADENIWFHSNGDYQSQKYSELNQINQDNVRNLKLNWSYRNGYVPNGRINNQSSPIYTKNWRYSKKD